MTDRDPLYYDAATDEVRRMEAGDTVAAGRLDARVLLDNAGAVPFTPEDGIESSNVQAAVAEVSGRYAGGRRQAYFPYKVRRSRERIQRVNRVGTWVAGDAGSSAHAEVDNTHGSTGHLYPFMTFAAVDANGNPHRDHDRLVTIGGPDLATDATNTLSTVAHATDERFVFRMTTGTWTGLNFDAGDTVYAYGWTHASGRWEVDSFENSDQDMVVIDVGNAVTTFEASAANREVRGTQSNSSGMNGYAEGLFMLANSLEVEERIRFEASGIMENPAVGGGSDAFVEFVLEPNPQDNFDTPGSSQYSGANRIRMLSGEMGATWTGSKRFLWTCEFYLGSNSTGDEYHADWTIEVEDVLSVSGREHVTGGHDFKRNETYLSPRFRVELDQTARLNTYDDPARQGQGLRLEIHKYDAGMLR